MISQALLPKGPAAATRVLVRNQNLHSVSKDFRARRDVKHAALRRLPALERWDSYRILPIAPVTFSLQGPEMDLVCDSPGPLLP